MELFGKMALIIHIIAGTSTLITGPLAIFYNFKNPKKHRIVGKTFFYAMLVVVVFSISGLIKYPHVAFYQFLFGIAILVLCGILRGVRSIFLMKGGSVTNLDWAYTIVLGLNGVWMLGMAAWHFNEGTMVAIPILFAVFGSMSVLDVPKNWRVFSQPKRLSRIDWMRLHTSTMLGAFTASTTAFTVNAAHFLPWWAQWFGPTMVILPLQFYFAREFKRLKEVNFWRPAY